MEPVKRAFTLNSGDKEIQSLEIMKEVLGECDSMAQDRIMMYLQSWVHSERGSQLGGLTQQLRRPE